MNYTLLLIFIIILMAMIGGAQSEFKSSIAQYKYDSNQSISGVGFANSYQSLATKYSTLRKEVHGSGDYISDASLKVRQNVYVREYSNTLNQTSSFRIHLVESSNANFFEYPLSLGRSLRAGPIKSLWSDSTCLKNFYKGGTSMDADFSRARNLKKDLEADLIWNGNFNGTALIIDANFQGAGHFGALLTPQSIKQASSLIDEDYLGSFSISKKFIAENLHKKKTWDDDWLPCCCGGWAMMKPLVQKDFGMSAQGVFDCNCYDLPVSALFQRTGFAASQKTTMEGA
jgi:hypothetical protein